MAATSYEAASSHYLSPGRRDPVKRFWEEPLNHAVLARAVALLDRPGPLSVLDVGAGTGDGLALLRAAVPGRRWRYRGLDADAAMVETARSLHADDPDAEFVHGDLRDAVPEGDVDLYLSAGVPWSHLSPEDARRALAGLLARARDRAGRTAVVVDVLGRYSLEWVPHWRHERWRYRMTFMPEGEEISALMSTYGRGALQELLLGAACDAGAPLLAVEYADRSVMVGRHTGTGTFHPDLPPYRDLVNRLYDGDAGLDLRELALAPPAEGPPEIRDFFTTFAALWNGRLDDAREREAAVGVSGPGRDGLARELCRLEHGLARGIGAAHSLIATVVVEGR